MWVQAHREFESLPLRQKSSSLPTWGFLFREIERLKYLTQTFLHERYNDYMVYIKRIYEPTSTDDGCRILVDRLWPRGISKQEARIDYWLKDVAPSNELREWFNHDVAKWEEFKQKYEQEIQSNSKALQELQAIINGQERTTLVFAAKDQQHNNAIALRELLHY